MKGEEESGPGTKSTASVWDEAGAAARQPSRRSSEKRMGRKTGGVAGAALPTRRVVRTHNTLCKKERFAAFLAVPRLVTAVGAA